MKSSGFTEFPSSCPLQAELTFLLSGNFSSAEVSLPVSAPSNNFLSTHSRVSKPLTHSHTVMFPSLQRTLIDINFLDAHPYPHLNLTLTLL